MEKDLTTGELAKMLPVSTQTVINWCLRRKLPYKRIGTGPRKITREDARAFLRASRYPLPEELKTPNAARPKTIGG